MYRKKELKKSSYILKHSQEVTHLRAEKLLSTLATLTGKVY